MANGQAQPAKDQERDPWERDPWEQPAGAAPMPPTPPPTIEQRVEESQIPAYSKEAASAIASLMGTLVKLPQQLLTPHETFGATREDEVRMGPAGRLLYNMPADIAESLMAAEGARQAAAARGEGRAAQTLAYLENSLMGPFVKKVEEAGPPAPGSWYRFGPETLGATMEAVGTLEAPRMATEAVAGLPERARGYLQSRMGAGERLTEKSLAAETGRFQGAQAEWEKNVRGQREKYETAAEQAQREQATGGRTYQEQIDEINRENEAQQHGFQMRQALERQMDTDSVALKNEAVDLEHKVWQEANRRMNASKPVGNPTSDSAGLIGKVKDVQTNVLQNIPENVKEFKRILGMEPGGEELGQLRQDVMVGQGMTGEYDQLPPEKKAVVDDIAQRYGGQVVAGEPLTWEKLQSLKTRLDARLRSGNMNSALQRAVSQVQDTVVDEMGNLLQQSGGNIQDWNTARDFYREWKEDFHEPRGPRGSGSPVAQSLQAVDPAEIRKPFGGSVQSTLGNRGVNTLRKYAQWGGDAVANRVEKIIADQRAQAALPKQYKPKPYPKVPVAPEETQPFRAKGEPPEARGIDIEKQRYGAMRDKLAQWKGFSKWEVRTLGLNAIPEQLAAWVLDRPSVLNWAKKLTKADWAHINAQPTEVQAATIKVIKNLADVENAKLGATAAGRGPWKQFAWYKGPKPGWSSLDPQLVRRAVDLGLVEASLGAAQKNEKSPGQQLIDLRAITEKFSDNPHMPIGPGQ